MSIDKDLERNLKNFDAVVFPTAQRGFKVSYTCGKGTPKIKNKDIYTLWDVDETCFLCITNLGTCESTITKNAAGREKLQTLVFK